MEGRRLQDMVTSLKHLHSEILNPVKRRISSNMNLDEKLRTETDRVVAMGDFYELVTASIFGGVPGEYMQTDNEAIAGKVDLFDAQKNKAYESKSCYIEITPFLLDKQIEFYKEFRKNIEAEVDFVIYRHLLKGIRSKWNGNARELFKDLAEKTLYSVVLPFDVILALYERKGLDSLTYKWNGSEGSTFDKCTCINLKTMTRFLKEPEKVLNDLNLTGFDVKRYTSPKVYVDKQPVKKFPFVIISKD